MVFATVRYLESMGRPPHGGRGLKYLAAEGFCLLYESPPARGAWIEISTVNL